MGTLSEDVRTDVLCGRICDLEAENAKLRDAMYAKAGKYALQHMDEDELRIWATQQAEYIEELKCLAQELYSDLEAATQYDAGGSIGAVREYLRRMRELGIEA